MYISMLSKTQGAGETHRPRPEPRRKAQKKAWDFLRSLEVGNGFSEGVDQVTTLQEPLINEAAVEKVELLVQDAISQGAKLVVGGKRHNLGLTFYEPTIISDVKNEVLIARGGGLAAYLFTNNIQHLWRVSEALEYGLVGVKYHVFFSQVAPFGGVKQSGLGREGSKYGLDKYLEVSTIEDGFATESCVYSSQQAPSYGKLTPTLGNYLKEIMYRQSVMMA
ncbi:putative succinate-semialdehyde dehydrogenase (NAD(+)) [Helianthus anomalus]